MFAKKKTIIFSLVSASLLFFVIVVAPWGAGYLIQSKLLNYTAIFNKNYPDWEYTIDKYQRGIFSSTMTATLTLKNPSGAKIPFLKILTEDKITHGPICFDFHKKDIQGCLAKLTSQIRPEKRSIIQFDQDTFFVDYIVTYNGKIESSLFFDKVSGVVNLGNKNPRFDFSNISYNFSQDLNSIYPSYRLSVKEVTFSREDVQLMCKIKNILINNVSKSNQYIAGKGSLNFDFLEVNWLGKKYTLEGYELGLETDVISNKYRFKNKQQLKKIEIDNVVYGPFQSDLLISKLPVQLFKDFEKIETSVLSKDEKTQKISNLLLNSELDIDFILENLTLQMPGGELSLNGKGNFIAKANQNKIAYGNSNVKYILSISKSALHNIVQFFLKPGEDGKPIMDMFVTVGNLIDTGKNYESFFVYKNNKAYANGASLTDELSKDFPTNLVQPFTPAQELNVAVWADNLERVKMLLNKGVDVHFINTDMKNPIHSAALMGNLDIVRLLLENKVPVDQYDYQGNTALYWASRNGHLDMVRFLLKKGASPNVQNTQGWTPLQEAAENGHKEIVEVLLQQKNILVNQTDKEGRTALFWAAKNGQNEIIQLLLNKGADQNIENIRGLKPIDIARQQNHLGTVDLLKN